MGNHRAALRMATIVMWGWAGVSAAAPSFTAMVIDGDFQQGYQVKAADINGDGRQDVVALSTSPSQLVWYRNPDWTRFPIQCAAERFIDAAPWDVDGDGDLDLAIASGFDLGNSTDGGLVHWAECPADPAGAAAWPLHFIDAVPTSHRLRWADLEGDGRAALLNLPIIGVGAAAPVYAGGVQFKAYAVPVEPKAGPWPARVISDTLEMAHGLAVVDWDGLPGDEVLTASFGGVTLHRVGRGDLAPEVIGGGHAGERPRMGSSEVAVGRLNGGARYVASIEPWHGHEVVVYERPEQNGGPWARRVLDGTLKDGHALACADLDGDGEDEIVAGGRGEPHELLLYDFDGKTGQFTRMVIGGVAMGAAGVDVQDMDGDGHLDILAIGTATDNVVLYRNTSQD